MAHNDSPLQRIKQTERALQQRLAETRQQVTSTINLAQTEAAALMAAADQRGQAAAQAFHQQEVKQTEMAGETIIATAHDEAAALQDRAGMVLDQVAQQIVNLVLPE